MSSLRDSTTDAVSITKALSQIDSASAVSIVANRLIELFTSGSVLPGTRLPAERSLAASLGVGRSAIREAMAVLEVLGIVDVRAGSGTYLRSGASDLLPKTMTWGLLIGARENSELLEIRSGLEIYVARLAAERATEDDIIALGNHVDLMFETVNDLDTFVAADRAFHRCLLNTAGNTTLSGQMHTIHALLRVWLDRAVDTTEQAALATDEHHAILEGIRSRNPDAAASAMATHMNSANARLGLLVVLDSKRPAN